jgi:uncharacterized protein (TIGR02271 family)
MNKKRRPLIIAVFDDNAHGQQAVNDLRRAGVSDDQVRLVRRGEVSTGLPGNLEEMGVPKGEIRYYSQEYEAGRTIITVIADGRQQEMLDILNRHGGHTAKDRPVAERVVNPQGALNVQLREEQLRASKQPVETGEVRLHKEVVSEQKNLNVPASHEEIVIERHPVADQAADAPIGNEETINVPVMKEQVTVEKQPVVREEIGLGKRQVQETQQVTDTVKKEEVEIERAYNENVQDRE